MKKQYTFVLNFGYVESARLSFMPWSSTQKYSSAKEALGDLANFFMQNFIAETCAPRKPCCNANLLSNSNFCKECGSLLSYQEFDPEAFEDWLKSMNDASIDSFSEIIESVYSKRWQSNGLEGALNQRFVYNAEWVLSAAIGYPHREDRTFEDICKDRTKNKEESFSYY